MASRTTALQIKKLFSKIQQLKVFVVGDLMLDQYWFGSIERISPEAPVPILRVDRKESRPGGAANVALNCRALGAEVHVLGVCGQDGAGTELIKKLNEKGIQTKGILKSKNRSTTSKTRMISKSQQVIRVDEEVIADLTVREEHQFIDTCLRAIQIEAPDILILEDYNKGLLSSNVIEKILTHCRHVGVFTAVDPKQKNFLAFQGVDLFKPNWKEVKEGLYMPEAGQNLSDLRKIHSLLRQKLQHRISLITLSEKGVFIQDEKEARLIPAHIRRIADVSGAGDTVISVAAMVYKVSGNAALTARIANLAGGLVCEELGVVPVEKSKLIQESIEME